MKVSIRFGSTQATNPPPGSTGSTGGVPRWSATLVFVVAALALILSLSCTRPQRDEQSESGAPSSPTVSVASSAYILRWMAEQIGGDRVRAVDLLAPGAHLHDAELDPAALSRLGEADLVVLLSRGAQPAVDSALDATGARKARTLYLFDAVQNAGSVTPTAVSSISGSAASQDDAHSEPAGKLPLLRIHAGDRQESPEEDPAQAHFWLDPVLVARGAEVMRDALAEIAPSEAEHFDSNLDSLRSTLDRLHRSFEDSLRGCASRTLVVYHSAYHFLAERYGLREVAVTGADPEAEPRPADVRAAVEAARSEGVRTVFADPEAGTAAMEQVAREAGAQVDVLDPIEGETEGADYVARMYTNLSKISAALRCS